MIALIKYLTLALADAPFTLFYGNGGKFSL